MPLNIKVFLNALKEFLDSPETIKDASAWRPMLALLKKHIEDLAQHMYYRDTNNARKISPFFTHFYKKIFETYQALNTINIASFKSKLWDYFYLCQILLQLKEILINTENTRDIFNRFEKVNEVITNFFRELIKLDHFAEIRTNESAESLVADFILMPDLFNYSGLRTEITQLAIKNLSLEALVLANNLHIMLKLKNTFSQALAKYLETINKKVTTAKETDQALKNIFITFEYNSINLDEYKSFASKFSSFVILQALKQLAPIDKEAFIHHLNTKTKIAWINFFMSLTDKAEFKKLPQAFFHLNIDNNHTLQSTTDSTNKTSEGDLHNNPWWIDKNETASNTVMRLATYIPKRTKTLGILEKPYINLFSKPFTKEEITATANLIKNICRFYLKMEPYTPQTLNALVLFYKYTCNKFTNLDQQLFEVIFKNRYRLKAEDILIFLHSSFTCFKEKNNFDTRIANFFIEIKDEIDRNLKITIDETSITLEDISLLYYEYADIQALASNRPNSLYSTVNTATEIKTDFLKLFIDRFNNDFLLAENFTCVQMYQLIQGMKACKDLLTVIKNQNILELDDTALLTHFQNFKNYFVHKAYLFEEEFDIGKFREFAEELYACQNINALFELNNSYQNFSINFFKNINPIKKQDFFKPCLIEVDNFNFVFFKNLLEKLIGIFRSENFANQRIHEYTLIKQSTNSINNFLQDSKIKKFFEKYIMLFSQVRTRFDKTTFYDDISMQFIKPTQRLAKYQLIIIDLVKDFTNFCNQKNISNPKIPSNTNSNQEFNIEILLEQLKQAVNALGSGADRLKRTDSIKLITPPTTPHKNIEASERNAVFIPITNANHTNILNTNSLFNNFLEMHHGYSDHLKAVQQMVPISKGRIAIYLKEVETGLTEPHKGLPTQVDPASIEKLDTSTQALVVELDELIIESNLQKTSISLLHDLIAKIEIFFTTEEKFCQQIKGLIQSMQTVPAPIINTKNYNALTELILHYKKFTTNLFNPNWFFTKFTKPFHYENLKNRFMQLSEKCRIDDALDFLEVFKAQDANIISEETQKQLKIDYILFSFIGNLIQKINKIKTNKKEKNPTVYSPSIFYMYPNGIWLKFIPLFIQKLQDVFLSIEFDNRILVDLKAINENYANVAANYPQLVIDPSLISSHLNNYYINLKNIFDTYINFNNSLTEFMKEYKKQEDQFNVKPYRFYDYLSMHINSDDPIYQSADPTEFEKITTSFNNLLKIISSFNQTKLGTLASINPPQPFIKRRNSLDSPVKKSISNDSNEVTTPNKLKKRSHSIVLPSPTRGLLHPAPTSSNNTNRCSEAEERSPSETYEQSFTFKK